MAIETFKRYEKKYMLTTKKYHEIMEHMSQHVELDENNQNGDFYTICNIYFDTDNDELIRRSIEKPVYKEKLRLRSYGVPELTDNVFLEIKKKYKGVVFKRRTVLELEEAYQFIEHGIKPVDKPYLNRQVVDEIEYFLNQYKLCPKLYLAYDRKAYFGKEDKNFRITFDTNIRTRRENLRLEYGDEGERLLDPDLWLMEVKIMGAAPLWFANMLSELELYPASFSKYGSEYKKMVKELCEIEGEDQLCSKQYSKQQQKPQFQSKNHWLVS